MEMRAGAYDGHPSPDRDWRGQTSLASATRSGRAVPIGEIPDLKSTESRVSSYSKQDAGSLSARKATLSVRKPGSVSPEDLAGRQAGPIRDSRACRAVRRRDDHASITPISRSLMKPGARSQPPCSRRKRGRVSHPRQPSSRARQEACATANTAESCEPSHRDRLVVSRTVVVTTGLGGGGGRAKRDRAADRPEEKDAG